MLADIVDRILRARARRRARRPPRVALAPPVGARPHGGVPDLALRHRRRRALGSRGARLDVPVHRLLGTYRDSIPAYASTITFATLEEFLDVCDQCLELGLPGDQAARVGRRARGRRAVPARPRPRRARRRPDVRRLGRLRPARMRSTSAARSPRPTTSGTRSRCASSASPRTSGSAERVDVPLLVGETSDGSHLNTADFIASGCATYVRTSANHRGGITGAMRIAHLADSFRLRAEVHGPTEPAVHLCMAIPNNTYYESLVTSNPVVRESARRAGRPRPCPDEPGIALPTSSASTARGRSVDHHQHHHQGGGGMKLNSIVDGWHSGRP